MCCPKMLAPKQFLVLIIVNILAVVSMAGYASAAVYYMPDDFPNLQAAMSAMSSGDTLVIRDGEYTGPENVIDSWHYPPNGSPDSYTTIKAEHIGKVVFSGEESRWMFYKDGNTSGVMQYVQFEGLVWKDSIQQNVYITNVNHIKFIACGFVDAGADSDSFATHTCSYILAEDCWSYGNARYHFHFYNTDYSIFRRCVVRHDKGHFTYQMGFQVYNSSHILVQNCIFIDSDQLSHYNGPSQYYAFKVPQVNRGNISFKGCIALNAPSAGFLFVQAGDNNLVENSLAWGLGKGDYFRGQGIEVSHCTYGDISGTATTGDGANRRFQNNILYNIGSYGLDRWGGSITNDYNSLYSVGTEYHNVTPGRHSLCYANSNAIDPIDGIPGNGMASLRYPVRVEAGSDLSTKGSDGKAVGANILYKLGVDGTLWGESGYDEETNEPLWPFPNEDIIRTSMGSYNRDGINGKRGFCADGTGLYGGPITLTSYIWEYLGHPLPSNIYGGDGGNQPPAADAGEDQTVTDYDGSGAENVTLDGSGSSDPDGTITSYTWSENGNQIATGESPTVSMSTGVHVITLKVTDNDGATGTDQVTITVQPQPGDTVPPTISDVQAESITSTSAVITWNTDEPAASKVTYGTSEDYGQQVQDTTLTQNHQVVLSGLAPDTTYYYKVYSSDASNNESSSNGDSFSTKPQSSVTFHTLQDFEDGVVWQPGGTQDPTGNGRGWAFLDAGPNANIEIANIGANGTHHSLKVTFDSDNPQIYFRSDDRTRDHMPEAQGANRMSFYVRFPEGFPIQQQPFRYDTWQLGTFIHDPNNWADTHAATFESDHGIHHYYHRFTIEQVGNGWVKYIINTHPDQANYSGSTVPPDRGEEYFNNFGRFYFHFGPQAGGPDPGRPFTIYIDEIKFYHDDGSIGGQVHDGGQNDAGFDGEFFADSTTSLPAAVTRRINFQPTGRPVPDGYDPDYGYVFDASRGYGWDMDSTGKARDKDVNADQALDTYIFADDTVRTWEIVVPNGDYKVSLACGEPEYDRGNHKVILEGEEVVNASTNAGEYITVTDHPVTVADGRLTVQIGGGQAVKDPWGLTSLNYIIIKSISPSEIPPPSTLTAQPANSIDLSWSSVNGAAGYNVYRSTTSGAGYVKINSALVTTTSYVDQDTTPGTTYYYVVTSVDSAGNESGYSPEAHATENDVPSITSFTAQPNIAENPLTTVTFSVQASDPDGDALTYTIDFGDNSPSVSGNTATHAYSSKDTYTATATVSDGHGHSVSQTLQITVNDNAPAKVTGVQVQ